MISPPLPVYSARGRVRVYVYTYIYTLLPNTDRLGEGEGGLR